MITEAPAIAFIIFLLLLGGGVNQVSSDDGGGGSAGVEQPGGGVSEERASLVALLEAREQELETARQSTTPGSQARALIDTQLVQVRDALDGVEDLSIGEIEDVLAQTPPQAFSPAA